ncbi:IS66 family transposase [Bradyrhizobium arachidis]|uniref:IS66 family transposase n=1 Tax=Bradyrhizobium arachidis TaxID=858423 RepID=UPI0021639BF9|nr:IS66 family transposase [Bradyrhizobium arachidis]
MMFLRDGRIGVYSNTVERSMCPIATQLMFSDSEGGVGSQAIPASLVNTEELHELDLSPI